MKEKVILGTFHVFEKQGINFNMDDIAKELKMSKKTIYKLFESKEELLLGVGNYIFDKIKDEEDKVYNNTSLSTLEKIEKIFCVLPDAYMNLDFTQLYVMKDKYPNVYNLIQNRLETGWQKTIALIEKGQKEGIIRDVNIDFVKILYEGALETFFRSDILIKDNITYQQAIQEITNILILGIKENNHGQK